MTPHKTDPRWTTHLHYHWWQYVLLAVLSIMIWTAVFDTLVQPAKNEKIGIVFFGDGLDVPALHQELTQVMGEITQQNITYVDVSQTFADSAYLGQILTARIYDCDLLILPAEMVDQLAAYGFFMPLPQPLQNAPTYTQQRNGETVAYGLQIYAPGCQNRFSDFCSGEQIYYVFFSKESVNLAGLNGMGNEEDDAALRILEYLLEEAYVPVSQN